MLTVSTAVLVMPPNVALMEAVPGANPVARPAVEIEATAGVADAQATWLVRSFVELSENVPVAVNGSVLPSTTLGLAGATAIDCKDRWGDRQHRRARDAAQRRGDRRRAHR